MRIALIAAGFPTPEKPSSGVFTLRAARALSVRNDVEVFHLRAWSPRRPLRTRRVVEGIPVTTLFLPQFPDPYRSRMRTMLTWRAGKTAGWMLLRHELRNFDVLHSAGAAFAGVMTSYWSRRSGRPHVAQIIGSDANSILPAVREWKGVRSWERNVDAFLCNSEALAAQLRALYPDVQDVSVVYRGTDLTRFSPPDTRSGAARFLFVGGFPSAGRNLKGGETLCAAWALAEERLAAAGATLFVAGPGADGEPVQAWRRSLRFPDAVTITGVIQPAEMPERMRNADVLLVPSPDEGLPNAAVEAAACACAIAGSHTGGLPEIVKDGETGILLPPNAADHWADALIALANDPESARTMGRRGRAYVEERFDASRYAPALERIYGRVLGARA